MKPRLRPSPLVTDVLVAVVLFAIAVVNLAEVDLLSPVFRREPDTLAVVLVAAQTLPLTWRRRRPVLVMGLVLTAFMVERVLDYPNTLASAGVVVALHALGSELPPRQSLRIGGSVVAVLTVFTALGALTLESVTWPSVATTFLFTALPLYLGREVHVRRQRIESLEERAARAEREREEEAMRAVAEERARIARELHDVVAHELTVMTLQAEGARRVARDVDPRVVDALATIGQTGREGLEEMRRMVAVLRTGPDDTELRPQPGLAGLVELVAHMREAGLDVELEQSGPIGGLAPGVDVNVYRIVQEGLTNVLRHGGPGAHVIVRVHHDDERVEVEVLDDGRGAAATVPPGGDAGAAGARGGHGLVGMRERVALLEGELTAGPRAGGGFAVRATIPVQP